MNAGERGKRDAGEREEADERGTLPRVRGARGSLGRSEVVFDQAAGTSGGGQVRIDTPDIIDTPCVRNLVRAPVRLCCCAGSLSAARVALLGPRLSGTGAATARRGVSCAGAPIAALAGLCSGGSVGRGGREGAGREAGGGGVA